MCIPICMMYIQGIIIFEMLFMIHVIIRIWPNFFYVNHQKKNDEDDEEKSWISAFLIFFLLPCRLLSHILNLLIFFVSIYKYGTIESWCYIAFLTCYSTLFILFYGNFKNEDEQHFLKEKEGIKDCWEIKCTRLTHIYTFYCLMKLNLCSSHKFSSIFIYSFIRNFIWEKVIFQYFEAVLK